VSRSFFSAVFKKNWLVSRLFSVLCFKTLACVTVVFQCCVFKIEWLLSRLFFSAVLKKLACVTVVFSVVFFLKN